MQRLFVRYWFLIGLVVLIPGGFLLGTQLAPERIEAFNNVAGKTLSRGLTAAVLFLMSITLDTRRLAAALRAPRPVLWATAVNALAMPLFAWPLLPLQRIPDFSVGLMVAAAVPCTMAAASVWTRSAGGNDAISLLVTTLTNGLCFVITPFWLGLASATTVNLGAGEMVLPLMLGGFVPILAGQLVRILRPLADFADRHKVLLGSVAQGCILGQVLWACTQAGPTIQSGLAAGDGWTAAGIAWGSCVLLHIAGLALAWYGGRALGLSHGDLIGATFAGSQKTLPIGVLIATDPRLLGGLGLPFVIFPMLMYHASQLVIDTVVAARIRKPAEPAS
ncbi:MAG: bile acid:sodium symporter [Planctomyces sp.]|nr:bile acid:sodium symporter [Planctomyces sp.]